MGLGHSQTGLHLLLMAFKGTGGHLPCLSARVQPLPGPHAAPAKSVLDSLFVYLHVCCGPEGKYSLQMVLFDLVAFCEHKIPLTSSVHFNN